MEDPTIKLMACKFLFSKKTQLCLTAIYRIISLSLAIAAADSANWARNDLTGVSLGLFTVCYGLYCQDVANGMLNDARKAVAAMLVIGMILQLVSVVLFIVGKGKDKIILLQATEIVMYATTFFYFLVVAIFGSPVALEDLGGGSWHRGIAFDWAIVAFVFSFASCFSGYIGILGKQLAELLNEKTQFVLTGIYLTVGVSLAITAAATPNWAENSEDGLFLGLFTLCDVVFCRSVPNGLQNDARRAVAAFLVIGIIIHIVSIFAYVAYICKREKKILKAMRISVVLTSFLYFFAVVIFGSPVGLQNLSGSWNRGPSYSETVAVFCIAFISCFSACLGKLDHPTPSVVTRVRPASEITSVSVSVGTISYNTVRFPGSAVDLCLEERDITTYNCDAIVMSESGCPDIVNFNEAEPGRPYKFKVSIDGPDWSAVHDTEGHELLLSCCIKSVLETASHLNLSHVATVAIGCGAQNQGSAEVCVPIILKTIENFVRSNPQTSLRKVSLVENNNAEVVNAATRLIQEYRALPQTALNRRAGEQQPSTWTAMNGKEHMVVKVQRQSDEYRAVEAKFKATLAKNIAKIERVQHKMHYTQFEAQKRGIQARLQRQGNSQVVSQDLFHGTNVDATRSICKSGFDRNYAGTNGTRLGHGVYFAKNASYSKDFALADNQGLCKVILAEVVTGNYFLGNNTMRVAPTFRNNIPYDSVVDDMTNPTIFVVFRDASAYAKYVITYFG